MKTSFLILSFLLISCSWAGGGNRPLRTAESVDVSRYVGKWYAVKSLPQFFTRNCRGQTADYEIINEKTISVLNTCLKEKGITTIKGKAVVKNEQTNAELEVTFNNFFTRLFRVKGDYTIVELDPNYEHVIVGSKDRKSLWFLSRRPEMPEEIIEQYTQIAKEEGFPVEELITSEF